MTSIEVESKSACRECAKELAPGEIKHHQGRGLCRDCYLKLTAPPAPTRTAAPSPGDLRSLLLKPFSYLHDSSFKQPALKFASFLVIGSSVYILLYAFLQTLSIQNIPFLGAITTFFNPRLLLPNIGIAFTTAAYTSVGLLLAHPIARKLEGRAELRESFNAGAQIYGFVFHLECALLLPVIVSSAVMSADLRTVEVALRVPCLLYAAFLFTVGLKRVHWFGWKEAAIAALPSGLLILVLSFIF